MRGLPLDHLGVAVRDLEAASAAYLLLGLEPEGDDQTVPAQGVRVRVFRVGESLLELLEPSSATSPVARFIAERGPGLHHVALRVTRLEDEVTRLCAAGARFLTPEPGPGRHGTRVVFLHPKWSGGVLIELVDYP